MAKKDIRRRKDIRLKFTDIDKWLNICQLILGREDGRDTLVYKILVRALLELRTRRRVERSIEDEIINIRDSSHRNSPAAFRKELNGLITLLKDSSMFGEAALDDLPKSKESYTETVRSDLLDKINAMLKPSGYVLILKYDPSDLSREDVVYAELIKLETSGAL